MDYIGRTMNICLILFMIFTTGSHCQYYSNRDIILTPNQLKTYPGKVLYYRPRDQAPPPAEGKPNTTAVPWEEVLKETVFLALNDNKTSLQQQTSGTSTDNALLLAKRQQKAIYNAPYVGAVDLSTPRFGDIVELAHGRLEHEGNESYFFVQHQAGADEQPQRNVTALWKVERIRHRDDVRGHRYELKFTVAPTSVSVKNGADHEDVQDLPEHAETLEMPGNRTFIVRDDDYPKYFAPFAALPNAILRKNDQMYDRMFFDLVQPHQPHQQQFGSFSSGTRFFRPAPVAAPQQTITLGQYLVQSLLSGGEAAKYHHHHQPHHYAPPGKLVSPGLFGGLVASGNRIKFPDSFTGSSHSVPKFYQHIHLQRPSIAPLAPTALPGSYLFHHGNDVQSPASSNIHQDFKKLVEHGRGGPTTPASTSTDTKPTAGSTTAQKTASASPTPNQLQQTTATVNKFPQKPSPFPQQQPFQQFAQAPTTPNGIGQQTPNPGVQPNFRPLQYSPLQQQQQQQQQQVPHGLYRPQQVQPPILIHPHAHPQLTAAGGPVPFMPPFAGPAPPHLIQSIPFYNPQGHMMVNHIPVMANHHVFQMSPSQPIAIPVHLQLIPPVASAAQLYAQQPPSSPQQQQSQSQQQQAGQSQPSAHQQPDGAVQAIPVRIMQPIPNPVHLYSPVHPFLPPLQLQQQSPFHYRHQHHQHHPIVTVTPKATSTATTSSTGTTSSSSSSSSTTGNGGQHHTRPTASNNQSVATPPTTAHQTHPTSLQQHHHHHHHHHQHSLQQTHPHHPHSYNAIPTVFKFTSSNAIHPQKAFGGSGTGTGTGAGAGTGTGSATSTQTPTSTHHHHQQPPHHRYSTPNVQISGPSISPSPPGSSAQHQRHRFSTPPGPRGSSASSSSASPSSTAGASSSSTAAGSSPSPTSATRASVRYTPAVGQVSGPTVSSTAANHRYAPLPTVPASPAGLREKFTAPAFQPAASESQQAPRKLEPPANAADAVGSPSNAVSPKYESFGVENAVTPTAESLLVLSPSSATLSSSSSISGSSISSSTSLSQSLSPATATASAASASTPAFRGSTTLGGGAFSYSNFIDGSGAVSVTSKLTSEQPSSTQHQQHRISSSSASFSPSTASISVTTQSTFIPPPKTYIQQLGPTIGVKYPPAFKSMPSVTILPPQIETPISSTLKTYQYLNHHESYDFIPSRVVELAHVKKMAGQKHLKRNKQTKAQKGQSPQKAVPPKAAPPPAAVVAKASGPAASHHHHVTVTSSKPLRFYPGDGPEYATHRPEAQLSVQLPPPEKDFTMTYYGTPKHNQKVQRPKNFVTPLHPYGGAPTTPLPGTLTTPGSQPSATFQSAVSTSTPFGNSTQSAVTQDFGRNVTTSTFRSATASSTAHYYKNRHEKSDDLTITTMRPRVILKTIYRQFPGSFAPSTSTSTEKPVQKWVPKRPRSSSKSTSGEFATSTLPSSARTTGNVIEQAVASSERDVVTKNPVQSSSPIVVSVRPTLDQQMQRVRASRGRSRYTYRRIPSGNPPPIPTGQQGPTAHQHSSRTSRMRTNSNYNTSSSTVAAAAAAATTTIKPVASVTSSVFDSNRIDSRSFEQQERQAEESVMAPTAKHGSNEKIKRDASDEAMVTVRQDESTVVPSGATIAEQLTAKQLESKQNPLEVAEPEKEYVMVRANIEPIATNDSNMVFFEASDASVGHQPSEESGRSATGSSVFDDLTMSIINHAKAIVNQTERDPLVPTNQNEPTAAATEAFPAASRKSIESNEIAHREDQDTEMPEVTIESTTTSTSGDTSAPVTESTISETNAAVTATDDTAENVATQTTAAADSTVA